jgi:hypothetical protein
MKSLLKKEKDAAKERIVNRGIIHFRADEEFMRTLLGVAKQLKTSPGTLCRTIVWNHLQTLEIHGEKRYDIPSDTRTVRESTEDVCIEHSKQLVKSAREISESLEKLHSLEDSVRRFSDHMARLSELSALPHLFQTEQERMSKMLEAYRKALQKLNDEASERERRKRGKDEIQ